MKVVIHAADEGGCGWYRLRWPALAAAAGGIDVELRSEIGVLSYDDGEGRRHVHAIDPHAEDPGDVVVFQRVLRRIDYETIVALQAAGRAVVVDIDDDFHALPPGHVSRKATSGRYNPEVNRGWLRKACRRADLVTVSTPALVERYAAHGRVRVLPNCVPEAMLRVGEEQVREPGPLRVGWTGSTQTHVGDLEVTGGGVARALIDHGLRFHVVGTGVGVARGLGLDHEPEATGWVAFEDYPAAYAHLDLAVVPLAENAFNAAKSWLKGIEAAALGVPFVASPTPDYARLACEGAGLLAGTPERWHSVLSDLLGSPEMRAEMAGEGRAVARRWTYEKRWGDWATAWADAATMARGRTLAERKVPA